MMIKNSTCILISVTFLFIIIVSDYCTQLKTMQANQVTKKTLKMSSVPATGAQEAKYKKPKPTNPKPFRLRTDVHETFFRAVNLYSKH